MIRNQERLALALLVVCTACLWAATTVPSKGKVTAGAGLHLREGPSTSYASLTVMPQGSVVDIVGTAGSWYKVNFGSFTGKYCYSGYIEVTETKELEPGEAPRNPHGTLSTFDAKKTGVNIQSSPVKPSRGN